MAHTIITMDDNLLLRLDIFKVHGITDHDVESSLMHRILSDPSFNTKENLERVARFTKVNKTLKQDGQEPLYLDTTCENELHKTMDRKQALPIMLSVECQETTVSLPPSYVLNSYSTYYANESNKNLMKKGGIYASVSNKLKAKETSDSFRSKLWQQIEKWVDTLDQHEIQLANTNRFSPYEYVCVRGTYGSFLSMNLDKESYTYTYEKSRKSLYIKNKKSSKTSVEYLKRKLLLLAKRRLRFPELIPSFKHQFSDLVLFIEGSNRQPIENT